MGIALPEPHEPKAEDRDLLRECRNLAYQLKTALVVLEGHSDLWQMADVIYWDLAGRGKP